MLGEPVKSKFIENEDSLVILPSSIEESQNKNFLPFLGQNADVDRKPFINPSQQDLIMHNHFNNPNILIPKLNLGKRKREEFDQSAPQNKKIKKELNDQINSTLEEEEKLNTENSCIKRKSLFDSCSSLSQPSRSTLLQQLKNPILEFCETNPNLLRPLIQIFIILSKSCTVDNLYHHFSGLFTQNYLLQFMEESNIEIQSFALDLLYPLLSNPNLLELTRVPRQKKSVLDRVVQFLSIKFSSNVHPDYIRSLRKRAVRILSKLVCLFADGTSEPLHDKLEFIINNDYFLSRLIILLHSEIEYCCTPHISPTTEW